MVAQHLKILCVSTKGAGSNEEARILRLLADLSPAASSFDRRHKLRSFLRLLGDAKKTHPDVIVLEGTGIAGGMAVMLLRLTRGIPFVVSSGDAIAPYLSALHTWTLPAAVVYERLLCRLSAGYVGWTPYLAGRALTLGASRAMSAPGFAIFPVTNSARDRVRKDLGVPAEAIVFGLVGTLSWYPRESYCYGLELVRAAATLERSDVWVVIVGDGDGRIRVEEAIQASGLRNVVVTGGVDHSEVPRYLSAFDVASLPQSVDGIGAFRYTTKLSEYVEAGLPVVMNQIPAAYDLDQGWFWRLPGNAPWDERYLTALTALMEGVTHQEVALRRSRVPRAESLFDAETQARQVTSFVVDLVAASRSPRRLLRRR